MEEKLKKLFKEENLENAISSVPTKELHSLVVTLTKSKEKIASEKKANFFKFILLRLHKIFVAETEATRELSNAIENCINNIDSIPAVEQVASIAEGILSADFSTGANFPVLNALPRCVAVILPESSCDLKILDVESGKMSKQKLSGTEYKKSVITRLCSKKWSPKAVTQFATVLRDFPLDEEDIQTICKKLFVEMYQLDISEVPSLVYQLLLLSVKGNKKNILRELSTYFDMQEERVEQAHHIESTSLQFIMFAVKQDQDLAKEYIKMVKSSQIDMSCFTVQFLFVIALLPGLSATVFKILSEAILTSYETSLKTPLCCDIGITSSANSSVCRTILRIADKTCLGFEFLNKSLLEYALFLLDMKYVEKKPEQYIVIRTKDSPMSPTDLATFIIRKLFNSQRVVRGDIIESLFNRVASSSGEVKKYVSLLSMIVREYSSLAADYIPKFKESVEYLAFQEPAVAVALLDTMTPLFKSNRQFHDFVMLVLRKSISSKEESSRLIALEGFLHMLKSVASGAQSSNISTQISSDIEIVQFLKKCLTQQASIRQKLYTGLFDAVANKEYLREPVFRLLYQHLQDNYMKKAIQGTQKKEAPIYLEKCVNGSKWLEPIAHLVFVLQLCANFFGESVEVESLDQEVDETEEEQDDEMWKKPMLKMKISLLHIISYFTEGASPEHFELDKNTNFSTTEGMENRILAGLCVGVAQALMEYLSLTDLVENQTSILVTMFSFVEQIIKLVNAWKPEGKNKRAGVKAFDPYMYSALPSIGFTNRLIRMLNTVQPGEVDETEAEALQKLQENMDFHNYTINTCIRQLDQFIAEGKLPPQSRSKQEQLSLLTAMDDMRTGMNDLLSKTPIAEVAGLLLNYVSIYGKKFAEQYGGNDDTEEQDNGDEDDESSKKKKKPKKKLKKSENPTLKAAQCIDKCIQLISTNTQDIGKLADFLCQAFEHYLGKPVTGGSKVEKLMKIIKETQTVIAKLFDCPQEAVILCQLLNKLYYLLYVSLMPTKIFTYMNEPAKWIQNICATKEFKSKELSAALVSNCLTICLYKGDLNTMTTFTRDVRMTAGSLLNNSESVAIENAIFTDPTVMTSAESILNAVQSLLNDIEWKFQIVIKMSTSTESKSLALEESLSLSQQERIQEQELNQVRQQNAEELIHTLLERMDAILDNLEMFIVTSVTTNAVSEIFLTVLANFYKMMKKITEWKLEQITTAIAAAKASGSSKLPSKDIPKKLIELVQKCAKNLTSQIVTFTHYYDKLITAQGKKIASSKAAKEGRLKSELTFAREEFEKVLIRLAKTSGENKLVKNLTTAVVSFKLNKTKVKEEIKEEEDEEGKKKRKRASSSKSGSGSKAKKRKTTKTTSKKKKDDDEEEGDGMEGEDIEEPDEE